MNYETYRTLVQKAADLVERQDYESALEILQSLTASDISDADRAMMCLNLAIVYDKLARVDDAFAWYDRGAEYERRTGACHIAERRAAYLAERGRNHESFIRYQELLGHSSLLETDKERIRQNLDVLLQRVT